MRSDPTPSAPPEKQRLPFFTGLNSEKILLLLKMLFSNPREFRQRLATALKWRFEKSKSPNLEHTELNVCLSELTSQFAVDLATLLEEPTLVEIEEEVTSLLEEVRQRSAMDILHSSHPVLAKVCYILTRCVKPSCVVETGVAFGISSAYILKALAVNGFGRLVSIDRPPLGKGYQQQVGSAIPHYLKDRWQLILGDSEVELPRLIQKLDRIDMFVHDSLHTQKHMTFEFLTIWPLMPPRSVLVADDIECNCAFLDWSRRSDIAYSAFIQEPDKKPMYNAAASITVMPSMGIAIKD